MQAVKELHAKLKGRDTVCPHCMHQDIIDSDVSANNGEIYIWLMY